MGLVGGVCSPGFLSHLSMTFRKLFLLPSTSLPPFGRDGMVTFSAHGERNEFLSADTLKLLKCKEGEGEATAGFLAVSVITQNEQSRWLVDGLQGPPGSECGESYGLYLEVSHSLVVVKHD